VEKTLHRKEYRILLRLLYEKRINAGLKQEELAERLGVHQSFISKTENGERRIDVVELVDYCGALGVSFPEVIGEFFVLLQK
jgi:transcriptional regulator with XRE-family HTH domain